MKYVLVMLLCFFSVFSQYTIVSEEVTNSPMGGRTLMITTLYIGTDFIIEKDEDELLYYDLVAMKKYKVDEEMKELFPEGFDETESMDEANAMREHMEKQTVITKEKGSETKMILGYASTPWTITIKNPMVNASMNIYFAKLNILPKTLLKNYHQLSNGGKSNGMLDDLKLYEIDGFPLSTVSKMSMGSMEVEISSVVTTIEKGIKEMDWVNRIRSYTVVGEMASDTDYDDSGDSEEN